PPVPIDRVQIQQVIANLMRNATESMKESPRRVLSISSRQKSERELVVAISDTGPGMSADALDKLFEPFHSSKPGGMGIGLTISKKIIESHGGRLWVAPNSDGGAIFHFSLPLEEESGV
ncbi:MAG: GHKL domain-containing protein, partial [Rhodospirillaceae bacterium]|nr:GHKL domain-containing protein [Rhodospirillaceae bacterium]